MRKLLLVLAAIGILTSTLGCANGPTRSWCRGAPCNTCSPPSGQPMGNTGACSTGTCNTGACSNGTTGATGSGFLGNVFSPSQSTVAPPVSLPGSSFDQAPAAFGSAPEFYGNTNNVGKIELPPISPYN